MYKEFKKISNFFSYKIAMPQLADACSPATLNKEIPNKAIAGATVIGVMYFSSIPTIPEEEIKWANVTSYQGKCFKNSLA